jgi:probable F420-dependent oxidoreductase
MLKLGIMAPFAEGLITYGPFLRDFGAVLEEGGVESVYTVEHVVVGEEFMRLYSQAIGKELPSGRNRTPMPDPLELLAYFAAVTETVKLGTAVVVAPLHSPAVLAKRVATVDRLSGGRMLLGLGIGWQEAEYAAVGASFQDKGARLEECIGAMRALWADAPATYHGRFVNFDEVSALPQPEHGRVPIHLAGNADAAVARAGRLADGWFPYAITVEAFEKQADLLRASAKEAGRDPSDIIITAWPGSIDADREMDLPWVQRFVDAGATRLITRLKPGAPDDMTTLRDQLRRYQDEVLAKLA